MLKDVEVERWYRNTKTQKVYRVIAIGRHSETLEEMVVYRRMADDETWVRPLTLFLEKFEYI